MRELYNQTTTQHTVEHSVIYSYIPSAIEYIEYQIIQKKRGMGRIKRTPEPAIIKQDKKPNKLKLYLMTRCKTKLTMKNL